MALSIRSRIYGGSGVLVALSLMIAGFAIWQIQGLQTQSEKLVRIALQNTRLLNINVTTETMRRSMNMYRLEPDAKRMDAIRTGADTAAKLLADAIRDSISPERKVLYGKTLEILAKLGRDISVFAAATGESVAEKATLFKGGDELTATTSKLAQSIRAAGDEGLAGQLETSILLVRVANWRFLATNDEKGPSTFKNNVLKANTVLASLEKQATPGVDARLFEPVKNALNIYTKAFDGASAALIKSDRVFVEDIRVSFEDIGRTIGAARESLDRDYASTQQTAETVVSSTVLIAEIVAALTLLVGGLIAFFIGRSIIKPIGGMTDAMTVLAGGNTSIAVPSLEAKDEMGSMARAVEVFKVNAIEVTRLREIEEATETQRVAQRKADMLKLANDFEGAVGEIIQTVSSAATELEASANSLSSTAIRTEQLSTAVSAAAEEAATNVQSVASASEEMSSSVNEISRQVQESSRIAGDAVSQAETTNARVNELSDSAKKIGDVVKLISTIAEQTNLLALNATIEAARAGEAGRGFAVVASEVKALAEQTSKATGEIGHQIAAIQTATEGSVGAIQEIGHTIGRISEISSTIAAAVEEQGAATQEISRNVQQAAQGTSEVAANICDVQRGSSETGSASSQVLSSAQSLSIESNRLKTEVAAFLTNVRAA